MTSTCVIEEDFTEKLKNLKYDKSSLPLQHITQMNITISLWKSSIHYGIESSYQLSGVKFWQPTQKIVLEKLSSLLLPEKMKEDLRIMSCAFRENLEYFFSILQNDESPPVAYVVNNYWRYLCWTQHGKINIVKTMKKIIDYSDVTVTEKYIYACNYCLTEKTQGLYHKLSAELQEKFSRPNEINMKKIPLVIIWTLCFKESKSFSEIIEQVYPNLLRWAVLRRNMVAVQYIVEQKAYNGDYYNICSILFNDCSDDMFLYFLRQMTPTQLEKIFLEMSICLPRLISCSKCHILFLPTAKYLLKIIKKMDTYIAVKILFICWHGNAVEFDEYKMFWKELIVHVSFNLPEGKDLFYWCLRKSLIKNCDIKTFKLVVTSCAPECKTELLYNGPGMELCSCLIKKEKLDFLDMIITDIIPQKNIILFKKKLCRKKAYNFCQNFIIEDQYEIIEEILHFLHFEENFDEVFPHKIILLILKNILTTDEIQDDKPLVAIDKFLKWRFKRNEEFVIKFKADVFNIDSIDAVGLDSIDAEVLLYDIFSIEQLHIENDDFKWELAEKYWKWIYNAAPKTDVHKEKLFRIEKILRYSCGKFFESVTKCIAACLEPEEFEELIEAVGSIDKLLKYFINKV